MLMHVFRQAMFCTLLICLIAAWSLKIFEALILRFSKTGIKFTKISKFEKSDSLGHCDKSNTSNRNKSDV